MEGEEIVEFSPHAPHMSVMKDILRNQGDEVCRQKIGVEYIRTAVNVHDFGLARVTPKAVMGQRQTHRFQLWGFVLCKVDPDPESMVTVELVCSRPQSAGTGRLLIELAQERSRERGLKWMRLMCLPEERLRAFYRRLGFSQHRMMIPGSNMELYEMRKRL
jgi:GNAT superfamily N-acetyltransferase